MRDTRKQHFRAMRSSFSESDVPCRPYPAAPSNSKFWCENGITICIERPYAVSSGNDTTRLDAFRIFELKVAYLSTQQHQVLVSLDHVNIPLLQPSSHLNLKQWRIFENLHVRPFGPYPNPSVLMTSITKSLSKSEAEYIFHHLVLPPQLPQEDDWTQRHCDCILQFVDQVFSDYSNHEENAGNKVLAPIREMVHRMAKVMPGGVLNSDACADTLEKLSVGDSLPLYIREQNAGLILRRTVEGLQVDCFEASPLTEDVITTRGALIQSFPADSVVIPWDTARDVHFRNQLSKFLADMSSQCIASLSPVSVPAGLEVPEIKDTANPTMLLHMAMNVLVAYGVRKPSSSAVVKRLRDDVVWKRGALLPWRRSPLWLVMRVGLQTSFEQLLLGDSTLEYKKFIAYLSSRVCQMARNMELSPDVISVASAKISRRISKLGSALNPFLLKVSQEQCEAAQKYLQKDWEMKSLACKKYLCGDINLTFEPQHTHLMLGNSRAYIDKLLQGLPPKVDVRNPVLECRVFQSSPARLPGVERLRSRVEIHFALAEIDLWVQEHLESWTTSQLLSPRPGTCTKLGKLLSTYFKKATSVYEDYPDRLSVAMLTCLELWQSLDRIVISIHPLLKEYSPDIPLTFLEPLLLTRRDLLLRLHQFETYLAGRHSNCSPRNPSVFSSPKKSSFTVRFFESSVHHQLLRFRIEEEANRQRDLLKVQHDFKSQQHRDLIAQCTRLTHEETMDLRGTKSHDAKQCRKCTKQRQAEDIRLNVHEWPLPADEVNCLAAVVELSLPESFAIWRDVTYEIQSLGRSPPSSRSQPQQEILLYDPLSSFQVSVKQQVTLASRSKTFVDSHYRSLSIRNPLNEFFVPSGLVYESYHTGDDLWLPSEGFLDMRPKFDYCKDMEHYESLHRYTQDTGQEINELVSEQHLCPTELSLNEFMAYGSLRSGLSLQWINILRELTQPNLSWRSTFVYNVLFQAVHQVEQRDPDKVLRKTNQLFLDLGFCKMLNNALESFIDRVQANWTEINSMAIATELLLKILSLTEPSTEREKTKSLLRTVRTVTMGWVEELIARLEKTTTSEQITKIQHSLINAAFICRRTFDRDKADIPETLTSDVDVACYIECAVFVENNCPDNIETLPLFISRAIIRDRQMSYRLRKYVVRAVLSSRESIDQAIQRIWHLYRPNFSVLWETVPSTGDRWLATRTMDLQEIHLDVLTGQLLVEGHRLGRLPASFAAHQTYKRIFGNQVLDVLVSSRPDTQYVTKRNIRGYEISFSMQGGDLLILTREGDKMLALIPSQQLQGDLPRTFVEDYTHWIDLTTGMIEFRPLDGRWQSSPLNWRIDYRQQFPTMTLGGEQLVDGQSQLFKAVARILAPIEVDDNLHVTYSSKDGVVIRLPRYNFHFRLGKESRLYSPELAAFVDSDQDLGTLCGLRSKLVLRNDDSGARSVLIPIGTVTYKFSDSSYTVVDIDNRDGRSVRYCLYTVDAILCRLRGPPDLYSGYYLAYLHALTTHIIQDPLTGIRGTEQALVILRQACMIPTEPLTQDEVELLEDIAGLSPTREFYPPHLQKMQTVYWDPDLTVSSQHDEFVHLARKFYAHSLQIDHFFDLKTLISKHLATGKHDNLLHRARVHNAIFRSYEFGGDQLHARKDRSYTPRSREVPSQTLQRVYETAYLLHKRPSSMEICAELWEEIECWREMSGIRSSVGSLGELVDIRLPTAWSTLYQYCQNHRTAEFALQSSFIFGTVALGTKSNKDFTLVRTLIALIVARSPSTLPPLPGYQWYNLWEGCDPVETELSQIIQDFPKPHASGGKKGTLIATEIERESVGLARHYMAQWPCEKLALPSDSKSFHRLDLKKATDSVQDRFTSSYRNTALRKHVLSLQEILVAMNSKQATPNVFIIPSSPIDLDRRPIVHPRPLFALFSCDAPDVTGTLSTALKVLIATRESVSVVKHSSTESRRLGGLLDELESSGDPVTHEYGKILGKSQEQYLQGNELVTPTRFPWSEEEITFNQRQWEAHIATLHNLIIKALQSAYGQAGTVALLSGTAPKSQIRNLLAILGSSHFHSLSSIWKNILILLASALTQYQRTFRLQFFMRQNNLLAFYKVCEYGGQESWSAEHFPSWLVFEADNDLMIRPIQARVAQEMLSLEYPSNSVLQLNMGDGKSSVIMPLVLLSLSDGQRLARALVLESLSRSMSYILRQTIGRLLNRQTCFLPFSRNTHLDQAVVGRIMELHRTCLKNRGVFLTQPEYLLSFKLTGVERVWAKDLEIANSALRANASVDSICWDVIDECDAILVDNQLVYTVGTQQIVHGGSERWKTIQEVLKYAMLYAEKCKAKFPEYVELSSLGRGHFPNLRLSGPQAGAFLADMIAEELKHNMLGDLNFISLGVEVQDAVLSFVKERNVSWDKFSTIQEHFASRPALFEKLLVIRGLLAHEVLFFLLESKRWRVDYGLHPSRCLMAVPYLAKDVPSPRAEFGHPDIALALTCMTYYYEGLTSEQLMSCFHKLFTTSDPGAIYREWVSESSLPETLHNESNVNLQDELQWDQTIYPCLRYQKIVVDFFINNFVFPREAKEFPKKLPASGWDIPSHSPKIKTVGFSGTNDSNSLLPQSIVPRNLAELGSTAARILTYSLQSTNNYLCAKNDSGNRLSVPELLKLIEVQRPKVTVLLDAGAQVLELKNKELVELWLKISPGAPGAIYFDESLKELTVLKRDGRQEPLISSVYNERIDDCLVYLDQVRTRGTDLKFPPGTRAAVTLSRRLGKDAAMQAFMRLRDFGHTHSVLVLAPPDIDREIRGLKMKRERPSAQDPLGMSDVLRWLFKQTIRNLSIGLPGWIEQGLSHRRRQLASRKFGFHNQNMDLKQLTQGDMLELIREWEEEDAKSIDALYSPERDGHLLDAMKPINAELACDRSYQNIVNVGKHLSIHDHDIVSRQQLYEREVELEVEIIRAVKRPSAALPEKPKVHADITAFVQTGQIPLSSSATLEIRQYLERFSFRKLSSKVAWSQSLRVTTDFATTVKSQSTLDDYTNNVNWILSSSTHASQKIWLVLSAFEANAILDDIRKSKFVHLHAYAPRIRSKSPMKADSMLFFNISGLGTNPEIDASLRGELALFAGGLYIDSYEEYTKLLDHLKRADRAGGQDGSVENIPMINLLRSLLGVRRKGEEIGLTHMGRLLQGRRLTERDFE